MAKRRIHRRNLVIFLIVLVAIVLVLVALLLIRRGSKDEMVAQLIEDARSLQKKGELGEAEVQVQEALRLKDDSMEAVLLLARLLEERNRLGEAMKTYERAARLGPEDPRVIFPLARLQSEREKFAELRATAATLREIAPEDPLGYVYQARCDRRVKDFESAVTALDKALKLDPENVSTVVDLGDVYLEMGDLESADTLLSNARVRLEPSARIVVLQAELAKKRKRDEKALGLYVEAGAFEGADVRVKLASLVGRAELGQTEAAIEGLRTLAGEYPARGKIRLALGALLMRQGEVDEALAAFEAVSDESKGPYLKALEAIVVVQLSSGRIESAKDALAKLEDIAGQHPQVMLLRARVLLRERKTQEAQAVLEQVVRKQGFPLDAHYFLGMTYLDRGLASKAREQFRAIGDHVDKRPGICQPMIGAMLALGDYEAAVARARGLLEADDSVETRLLLGLGLASLGQLEEAVELLEAARADAKTKVRALAGLANVAIRKGERAKASALLDEILAEDGDNIQVHVLKADMLFTAGKKEESAKAFQDLMARYPDSLRVALAYAGRFGREGEGEGFEELEKTVANPKSTPGQLRTVALFYRGRAKLDDAIRVARLAYERDENDVNSAKLLFDLLVLTQDVAGADTFVRSLGDSRELKAFKMLAAARIEIESVAGRHETAEKQLLEYMEDFPGDLDGKHFLGLVYLRQGRTEDAIAQFDEIIEKEPQRVETLVLLTRAYEQSREWPRAEALCEELLERFPTDSRLLSVLTQSQSMLGKQEEALATCRRLIETRPDAPSYRMRFAQMLLANKRAEEALERVRQWRKAGPDSSLLVALEADATLALGKLDDAIGVVKSAYEKSPEDFSTGLILSGLYARLGKPEEARETAETVLSRSPENPGVVRAVAKVYTDMGDPARAWELLHGTKDLWKDDLRAALEYSRAGLKTGNGEEVSKFLETLSVQRPNDPNVATMMGMLRGAQRRFEEAIEHFTKASRMQPDNAGLRYELSKCHLGLGERAAAERELELALALNPRLMPARLLYTTVLRQNRKVDEAIAVAEDILKDAPGREDVHVQLCEMLVLSGNVIDSAEAVKVAKARFPKAPWPYLMAAKMAVIAGKNDAAIAEIESAIKKFPESLRLHSELAGVLILVGRKEDAVKRVEEFAAKHDDSYAAHVTVGRFLERAGRIDEAEKKLLAVAERFELAQACGELGDFYKRRKDLESVVSSYEEGLKRFPGNGALMLGLAQGLMEMKETARANKVYRDLLAQNPRNALALNNLAWNLSQEDVDLSEAVELAGRAAKEAPGNTFILDTLGFIYLKRGEIDKAERIFRRCVSRQPEVPVFRFHLASALIERKANDEAMEQLTKALESEASFEGREEAERILDRLKKGLKPQV